MKARRRIRRVKRGAASASSYWTHAVRFLFVVFFKLGLFGATVLACVLGYFILTLPDTRDVKTVARSRNVVVQGEDGRVLASYGDVVSDYIPYEKLPQQLIDAVLSTEDRRFFQHFGVDPVGVVRALWVNYQAGGIRQGGSTITQQLAKNLFLTPERTMTRKIQEAILALKLELEYSKEEILAQYLNVVYLGAGTFGVDAASRRYFGKPVTQIDLAEAAMIAGLLKAPSRYSPTNNPALARSRANQIILNMVDAGYVPEPLAAVAEYYPMPMRKYHEGTPGSQYFTDWVLDQLPDLLGNWEEDLVVTVTLRQDTQAIVEQSLRQMLDEEQEKRDVGQGAVVVMAPDGAVMAMAGGRDYEKSQFNRATQALRQPGSAFKTFVYLAGLQAGFRPNMRMEDRPITIRDWSPKNYSGLYRGWVTLDYAFSRSLNTVAVQLSERVGRHRVREVAKTLGITASIPNTPSLALGAAGVSLLEMTQAYAHLARNGLQVKAYGIREVRTRDGRLIYTHADTAAAPARVISDRTVSMMHHLLQSTVERGTGKQADIGRPVAGKTGTSQGFRDALFIGYTPQYVTGVWLGNDDNSPMQEVTGGNLPAMLWQKVMASVHETEPVLALPRYTAPPARYEEVLPWKRAALSSRHPEQEQFWNRVLGEGEGARNGETRIAGEVAPAVDTSTPAVASGEPSPHALPPSSPAADTGTGKPDAPIRLNTPKRYRTRAEKARDNRYTQEGRSVVQYSYPRARR